MNRTWRFVIAAGVSWMVTGGAFAGAPPTTPGVTRRLYSTYKKSYAGQADRTIVSLGAADAVRRVVDQRAYDDTTVEPGLVERMAHAESRASLVAEFETKARAEMLADAAKASRPSLWARSRSMTPVLDERELKHRVAEFEKQVDLVTHGLHELDTAIAALPNYLQHGIRVGSVYGDTRLQSVAAREAFQKKILAAAKTMGETPSKGLQRIEQVLQTRLTQQINSGRSADLERYRSAPVEDLHAEAQRLILDVGKYVSKVEQRTQTIHTTGSAESTSVALQASRSQLAVGGNTIRSPFVNGATTASASHTDWDATGQELTEGKDYTLFLSSTTTPLVVNKFVGREKVDARTITPFEARLVLEKVVRIGEIHEALIERKSPLADKLTPWITGSRISLREPVVVTRSTPYGVLEWSRETVVLAQRAKADLGALGGGRSFIDEERVRALKKETEDGLVSDLK